MNCVWKVIADSQFYLSSVWRGLCLSLPVLEIIFFLVREIYFLVVNGQSFLVIDGYLLNPFRYFSEIIIVILFLVFIYQSHFQQNLTCQSTFHSSLNSLVNMLSYIYLFIKRIRGKHLLINRMLLG